MERSIQTMRLEIDGQWSAFEFGQTISTLSDLYDLRCFLEMLREDQQDLEHAYDEMLHFPPFRRQLRRGLNRWGPFPWLMGSQCMAPLSLDDAQLSRLHQIIEPEARLEVRRIRYSSPGFTDLAGFGTVIGHVKDFVSKLIDRHDSKRQRDLNDERSSLENDRIRLDNARNFVALARDLGYSETEIRRLVAHVDEKQEVIVRLVDQQKLRSIGPPKDDGKE